MGTNLQTPSNAHFRLVGTLPAYIYGQATQRGLATTEANTMWETKTFKTFAAIKSFYERDQHRYQIAVIYIENGFACEYCKLVKPRMPR